MASLSGQAVYRGQVATAELDRLLVGEGDVLVIAGKSSYQAGGIGEKIGAHLEGRRLVRFCEFSPNPQLEELLALRQLVSGRGISSFSSILALGGGTAIDLAKLIKAFASGESPDVESFRVPPASVWDIPLIAIPTTAGSGSEATPFAVVYVGETKYSLEHLELRPEVCLLIPELLASLPKRVAAASGLDALCQGIESYWSIHSTESSRDLAKRAIALAWENLEIFVNQRTPDTCSAMSDAAYLAGRAIALTKTTAPHAVSYPITARFGVAHGHAVALMLAAMFPFNAGVEESDVLDLRGVAYVCARLEELHTLLGVKTSEGAGKAILELVERVGLEVNLLGLGIVSEDDIQFIVANGFNPSRVNNNPRRLTREALAEILRSEITAAAAK